MTMTANLLTLLGVLLIVVAVGELAGLWVALLLVGAALVGAGWIVNKADEQLPKVDG